MITIEGIKNKEVINMQDGRSLGYAADIEIDLEKGVIDGIVMPPARGHFSMFGKSEEETIIRWQDVKVIGEDVILVDLPPADPRTIRR